MLQTSQKKILFYFLSILSFVIAASFLVFKLNILQLIFNSDQVSVTESVVTQNSIATVDFGFTSEISNTTIKEPVNRAFLDEILRISGFNSDQLMGVPGEHAKVKPELVHIVFRDISLVPEPGKLWLVEQGAENITSGVDSNYDPKTKTLTYYVYVVPSITLQGSEKEAMSWTWHVAKILYAATTDNPTAQMWKEFREQVNQLRTKPEYKTFFILEQKNSLLLIPQTIANFVNTTIPLFNNLEQVFAQTCGGYRECGTIVMVHDCLYNQSCNQVGENYFCSGDLNACTWSESCQNGAGIPDGCNVGGQACNDTCPFGTCSEGMINTCSPQQQNCAPNQIYCGATCGCMPNSQTCSFWNANNCVEPGGGGGGGGGENCADLNLNCGQICQNPPEPLGAGVCTPDMTSCGYLPGQTYNVCWHDCCNGGGGGGTPGPATGPQIIGDIHFKSGTPESLIYPGRLRYWPVDHDTNPFRLRLYASRSGYNRWNDDYSFSILPGDSLDGEYQVGEEISVTFRLPEETDPGYSAGEGLENYDCEWYFTGNPGGPFGNNVDCGIGEETMSGDGCTATFRICSSSNPEWPLYQNHLNWNIKPKPQKQCLISFGGATNNTVEYNSMQNGTFTVAVTASSDVSPEDVKLYVTTKETNGTLATSLELDDLPTSERTVPAPPLGVLNSTEVPVDGRYYYDFAETTCNSGNGSDCTTVAKIRNLTPGDYYFICNLPASNPFRCSGNPWYAYEGLGGTLDSNTWLSCHDQPQPLNWSSSTDNRPLTVTCTPSCADACGGSDGCGGQCPNTDDGIPGTVTGLTPPDGDVNMQNANSTVAFSWDPPDINGSQVDSYEIRIFRANLYGPTPPTPAQVEATNCGSGADEALCVTRNSAQTTYAYTPDPNKTYKIIFAIKAINNTCSPQQGEWLIRTINLTTAISGGFYEYTGSGSCPLSPAGLTEINFSTIPSTATVQISSNATGITSTVTNISNTSSGTNHTFATAPFIPDLAWGEHETKLTISDSNPVNSLLCACGVGEGSETCTRPTQLAPGTNATAQHFYLTSINLSDGPWWQAREGNVYGASAYASIVPDLANSFLITQNTDNNPKSAGIPLGGSTIDTNGFYTEYNVGDPPVTQPRATNTTHTTMVREDYEYLVKNIDLDPVTDLAASRTTLPDPASGTLYGDARLFKRTGNFTLNLDVPQIVASTTKMILFVSGDVIINNTGAEDRHLITVQDGGYFAIIAGGNITFANEIGNTCSYPTCSPLNTNIDGVYVASNQLIIADDSDILLPDNIFIGEGTFVGWNGIMLNRSFDNNTNPTDTALNSTYPTNLFRFRPDLTQNTPEILTLPNLVWQEVN